MATARVANSVRRMRGRYTVEPPHATLRQNPCLSSWLAAGTPDASIERVSEPKFIVIDETDPDDNWRINLTKLLAEAAAISVVHDVDGDAFVRGAWSAYLEARPGMREQLEELHLRSRLDKLRKSGLVPTA